MTTAAAVPTLGLMVVLGLRHGLDPDHVAVIDNLVFRAVEQGSRLAPWMGSLFALGHSVALGAVAIGMSVVAGSVVLPAWTGRVVEVLVVAVLLLVGTLNLSALRRRPDYAPVGCRTGFVPRRWRASTRPGPVVAVGFLFGLVFDTATQAAAWGAAATAVGGMAAAAAIAGAFAIGMVTADTLDSQIVGRLLRSGGRAAPPESLRRYRRAVGWVVVALSFVMAGLSILEMGGVAIGLDADRFSAMGAVAAILVVALVRAGWRAARRQEVAR